MFGLLDPRRMRDNPNYDRGMFQLSQLEQASVNIQEISLSACESFHYYELAALLLAYGRRSVLHAYQEYKTNQ